MTMQFALASRPFREGARISPADLLPIVPPGAKIGEGSKIDPSQMGKIPGRYKGDGTWVGLTGGWPVMPLSESIYSRFASWPTANVGIRGQAYPGLDLDVPFADLRDELIAQADLLLGPAPIRLRGNSPRALLAFRAAGEVRKVRVPFVLKGEAGAVEFLGKGQQWVASGIHPSGDEYHWKAGFDLATWGADGLTAVTQAAVNSFMDGVVVLLQSKGATIGSVSHATSTEGTKVAELDGEYQPDVALSALRAIPNTPDVLGGRDELVKVLASFKAAVGRRAEEFTAEARDWSLEHGWCEADYFDKVWASITVVRTPASHMIMLARRFGWHADAPHDFEPISEQDVAIMAKVDAAEAEKQASIDNAAKQLAYWAEKKLWIVLSTGELLDNAALNYHSIGTSVAPAGRTGMQSASALVTNHGSVRRVVGITYLPGAPQIVERTWQGRTGVWFNTWRAGPALTTGAVSDKEVGRWLDHMTWLFPDEAERDVVVDWIAHVLQHPGVKIRWAPVIIGTQGIGKDLMLKPLLYGVGQQNVTEIDPYILADKWGGWKEHELVIVQEMQQTGKFAIYDKIKVEIAGTGDDTVMVEKKHMPSYPIPNTFNMLFFSNHEDAFAIPPDDRRLYVAHCAPVAPRVEEYYTELCAWYATGGLAKVARWLKARNIKIRPDKLPAWTEAKRTMLADSAGMFGEWLGLQFESGHFKSRTVISQQEIAAAVHNDFFPMPQRIRNDYNKMRAANGFRAAGWIRVAQQVVIGGTRQRVWCRDAEVAALAPALIKLRLEREMGEKVTEFAVIK